MADVKPVSDMIGESDPMACPTCHGSGRVGAPAKSADVPKESSRLLGAMSDTASSGGTPTMPNWKSIIKR